MPHECQKRGVEQEKQTEEVVEVGFVQGNNTHKSRYVGNTQHAALSMRLRGGSCHWHWPRISAAAPEVEEVNVTPPFFGKAKRGIELCLPPTRLGPERAKNDGR